MAARISEEDGMVAVRYVRAGSAQRDVIAMAVRFLLQKLAAEHPGRAVEVRVPPYGAVQCVEGPKHTRGTPPNVVEMSPETWVAVATGDLPWVDAAVAGRIAASGSRSDLSQLFPVV